MAHREDTNADAGRSHAEGERLDLGEDLEDSFDLMSNFGDFSEVRNGDSTNDGGDPENELFDSSKNNNSLREQAVEDKEILANGTINGAPIDIRDRVVPIVMWLLFGAATIIGGKTAIDAVGPAAGPLWEFRQAVSTEIWVPLVDAGQNLAALATPILEHNVVLTVLLVVAGLLILRNRRF